MLVHGVIGFGTALGLTYYDTMASMTPTVRPLLDPTATDQLRAALTGFTVDGVHEFLGPIGRSCLERGDLAGVARLVRASGDDRLATLTQLFLLAGEVDEARAGDVLAPLPLSTAQGAGLIDVSAGAVRSRLDLRPYAEQASAPSDAAPWWVVSDFGSDVRGGPLAADHVLGVGAAALTLAQATPRTPVHNGLDIGTGCGIQALHLGRHADRVVATDVSHRALRLAATTAALSSQKWDLRSGSLLDPVAGEEYDLIVTNPPFVVSAGAGDYDYRDSGMAGDDVCRRLVSELPGRLTPGGTAQLLANWIIPADGTWQERVAGWLDGRGCDAWVWQREIADPHEYVALWLRDAGESPGTPRWVSRYDAWLDWFAATGVAAVGMGLITLWRSDAADPVIVMEDVRQPLGQPIGPIVPGWIARNRWLADIDDDAIWNTPLRACADLVRERHDLLGEHGWSTARSGLRQSDGMRWELEVDDAVASLVAACDGSAPLRFGRELLAASLGEDDRSVAAALIPVVRDLIARGVLLPPDLP